MYLKEKKYKEKKKSPPAKGTVSGMQVEIVQILELSKKLVNSLTKKKDAVGEIFKVRIFRSLSICIHSNNHFDITGVRTVLQIIHNIYGEM